MKKKKKSSVDDLNSRLNIDEERINQKEITYSIA